MIRSLLPAALILLAGVATAQDSNSTSRAEAHAEAHSDSSRTRSSHTRRVVVVNGKTIVDEETVDGKPVRRKARNPPQRPMDAERLLEEVERDLPPEARELLKRARKDGATGTGHKRRVKVVNGKTVIDEETIDGKPVRRKAPKARRPVQRPMDAERLLDEVERDLPPEARELLNRARKDRTTGSNRGRRVKVVNGKSLIDEQTVDGKPFAPRGLRLDAPSVMDPKRILRELGRDLPPEARERLDRALEKGATGRGQARRVVEVNGENGKKGVDEKPVEPGQRSNGARRLRRVDSKGTRKLW